MITCMDAVIFDSKMLQWILSFPIWTFNGSKQTRISLLDIQKQLFGPIEKSYDLFVQHLMNVIFVQCVHLTLKS